MRCLRSYKFLKGSFLPLGGNRQTWIFLFHSGFPIRKPSRRSTKEVNPIRQLISPSQRLELVVVPIINQRITKNEVAWNLWCTFNTTPQAKRKNNNYECQHAYCEIQSYHWSKKRCGLLGKE
ncbi:hypothetical protein AAZX31_10G120000 [Glycine max]